MTDNSRAPRFVHQRALVTGAGSGIGAATALALAAEGAHVVCADVVAEAAAETAERVMSAGHSCESALLDVTDESSWERVLMQIGELNLVVHAAGISAGSPITEMTLQEWRHVMSVNLDGSFLAMKYGVRALMARGGSITVLGSASGIKAAPGAAAYSASKAGVRMLVEVVAKECRNASLPIRVNSVSPAGVRTPMWSSMPFFREMVGRLGSEDAAYAELSAAPGSARFATPEQVASAVCFLASDTAALITGTDVLMDDGYTI
jgi:NAD(P)-dependent dehydrogenase (short-subunit alcohol dehydrogenase family)